MLDNRSGYIRLEVPPQTATQPTKDYLDQLSTTQKELDAESRKNHLDNIHCNFASSEANFKYQSVRRIFITKHRRTLHTTQSNVSILDMDIVQTSSSGNVNFSTGSVDLVNNLNGLPPDVVPTTTSTAATTTSPAPPFSPKSDFTAKQYLAIAEDVRIAIIGDIQPQRISKGSSGSYFCRNLEGQVVGVFKPKNEEPYGHLNPKWTKWLHKTCCPCFFGRSCLIPNLGYISEAAASLVDRHLDLKVVPRTEIIHLASPSFFYSRKDRKHARKNGGILPPKIGSMQLFMHGFMDATTFLREGPHMLKNGLLLRDSETRGLDPRLQKSFQGEFERLVILDYIIRNTDRGLDNWMVKYDSNESGDAPSTTPQKQPSVPPPSNARNNRTAEPEADVKLISLDSSNNAADPSVSDDVAAKNLVDMSQSEEDGVLELGENVEPTPASSVQPPNAPFSESPHPSLIVAAIDNGLAFPFKHPDQWRSYPYGWASLPAARVPFSMETRQKIIPLLTSRPWWELFAKDLRLIFKLDADFDEKLFRRQLAVMKGQMYNVVQILRLGLDDSLNPVHVVSANNGTQSPISTVTAEQARTNAASTFASDIATHSSAFSVATAPLAASSASKSPRIATPFDLVMLPSCLVWEDADLKDLVGGKFGADVLGKNGFLGTIIGGYEGSDLNNLPHPYPPLPPQSSTSTPILINIPPRSRSLDQSRRNGDRHFKHTPDDDKNIDEGDFDDSHVGEFLTSPSSMLPKSSGRHPDSRRYSDDDIHNWDEEEDPNDIVTGSANVPSTFAYPGRKKRRRRRRRSIGMKDRMHEISSGLDAFKGRVITFVKSRPWLKFM